MQLLLLLKPLLAQTQWSRHSARVSGWVGGWVSGAGETSTCISTRCMRKGGGGATYPLAYLPACAYRSYLCLLAKLPAYSCAQAAEMHMAHILQIEHSHTTLCWRTLEIRSHWQLRTTAYFTTFLNTDTHAYASSPCDCMHARTHACTSRQYYNCTYACRSWRSTWHMATCCTK